MKKTIEILLLALLLAPSQFLMFSNYKSLDGAIHSMRIKEFHIAIENGQIPPRLAPTLIESIGYPLFTVNYQLPYYIAEPIMALTNNAQFTYKLVMSLTFIAGSVFAYLLFKELFSTQAAFAGSIIFTYLPYRFGNLYQRGAFGESVSLTFVPLIILALHLVVKRKKYSVPILAISIFGLITSHTIIFMIFAPLIFLYVIVLVKPNVEQYKRIFMGLTLGFSLSAFQLLPSIFEKKFMTFESNLSYLYQDFFLDISQLLRIPQEGLNLGTHYQIGIVSTVIILASLLTLTKRKTSTNLFFVLFAILSIFMTTKYSFPFWQHVPLMSYIIFPYRFLSLTIFVVAFLSAILIHHTKQKTFFAILIIVLTIYTNRHYFTIAPWFEIEPPPNLTTQNENDTIWQNENSYKRRETVTSSNENTKINTYENYPYNVKTLLENKDETTFIVRKLYFPGWNVKVNGQIQQIKIDDGLISFNLPPGKWDTEIYFSETPARKTANSLTLVAIIISLYLVLTDFKTSYEKKKAKK